MIALEILGTLLALAGVTALFLTWQRRGVREGIHRYGLPAGWILIGLGLAAWGASMPADNGLALGTVVVMGLACALIAWQGLKLWGKPAKVQRERESATDGLALGAGYWGRFAVRLLGSLIVVPALGLLAGLLWRGYMPGDATDVLIAAAFVVIFAMTGALTWLLASRRPYRACGVLVAASLVVAGLIYLPILTGA